MGGEGTPEEYGRLLRQFTQEAKDVANQERRGLYASIDPQGTLNVVSRDVRGAADRIAAEAGTDLAKPLEYRIGGGDIAHNDIDAADLHGALGLLTWWKERAKRAAAKARAPK
jgi:pyruvate/2-oxoglutarate dehydrogenase complex dihydrolipoamide acyltransferase (E2) component